MPHAAADVGLPPAPALDLHGSELSNPDTDTSTLVSIAGVCAARLQPALDDLEYRRGCLGEERSWGIVGCVAVAAEALAYVAKRMQLEGGKSTNYVPSDLHRALFETLWPIDLAEPKLLHASAASAEVESRWASDLADAFQDWFNVPEGQRPLPLGRRYWLHEPATPHYPVGNASPPLLTQDVLLSLTRDTYTTRDGHFFDNLFRRLYFKDLVGNSHSLLVASRATNLACSALDYLRLMHLALRGEDRGDEAEAEANRLAALDTFRAVVLVRRFDSVLQHRLAPRWLSHFQDRNVDLAIARVCRQRTYDLYTANDHLRHALDDHVIDAMMQRDAQHLAVDVHSLQYEYRAARDWIFATFSRRYPGDHFGQLRQHSTSRASSALSDLDSTSSSNPRPSSPRRPRSQSASSGSSESSFSRASLPHPLPRSSSYPTSQSRSRSRSTSSSGSHTFSRRPLRSRGISPSSDEPDSDEHSSSSYRSSSHGSERSYAVSEAGSAHTLGKKSPGLPRLVMMPFWPTSRRF